MRIGHYAAIVAFFAAGCTAFLGLDGQSFDQVGGGPASSASSATASGSSSTGAAPSCAGDDAGRPGDVKWAGVIDGTATTWVQVAGVALDSLGNAWVTGTYQGTLQGGGCPGSHPSPTAPAAFVASFSADGACHLLQEYIAAGPGAGMNGLAIAIDPTTDSPIIAGQFAGTFDGHGALGGADAFVMGIRSTDAGVTWMKSWGSAGSDLATCVAATADSIYFGGRHYGDVYEDNDVLVQVGGYDLAMNTTDGFIAKMSATTRALDWMVGVGSEGSDSVEGIAVDATGSVVATGYFAMAKEAHYDATHTVAVKGAQAAFIGYLDEDGRYRAGAADITGAMSFGYGVAVDAKRSPTVVGTVMGPLSFGGAVHDAKAATDAFALSFDASVVAGASLYAGGGASAKEQLLAVTIDCGGNPVVAGTLAGQVMFSSGTPDSPPVGTSDAFVASYDAAFTSERWSLRLGSAAHVATGLAIATRPNGGSIVAAGTFESTIGTPPAQAVTQASPGGFVIAIRN